MEANQTQIDRARRAAAELVYRSRDGLDMFRALSPDMGDGFPDQVGLFKDKASECLVSGGNRSGKSMCAATLFASIARDKPITAWNGEKIETRLPHQKDRLLQMWVIGLKIEHFSTIYRLLFRSGVYKRIKDKDTGKWRAFQPWIEDDADRRDECRGSFPLIPPHEIDPKSMAFHSKAKNEITHVLLPGKAEIWCFPSTAKEPRQGEPVDVVWIDEAIENPDHYTEWLMRLADERGRIFWSSYQNKKNEKLIEIRDRAEEQ
ncbi:MAG: hypothetical protein ACO39X_08305, partial [Candidatus Nanopelagicaceae bacterium]